MKKKKNAARIAASVKLPEESKQRMLDWCWIHRTTFSGMVERLIEDFLRKNPLSPEEQARCRQSRIS